MDEIKINKAHIMLHNLKSKTAYITFYKLVCFLLTLLSLFALYKFGAYLWETRQPYIDTIQNNILGDKSYPAKSTEEMLGHLKDTGIALAIFIAVIISISIVKKIWKSLPVPGSFIKYWDDHGQVSHILGRCICNHLRSSTGFSNEEWANTVQYAKSQTYYFLSASNSKNYSTIFQKYDKDFYADASETGQSKSLEEQLKDAKANGEQLKEKAIALNVKQTHAENRLKQVNEEKVNKAPKEPTLEE